MKLALLFVALVFAQATGWTQQINADSTEQRGTGILPEGSSGEQKKRLQYFLMFQTGSLAACTSCWGGKQLTYTASITQGITLGNRLRIGAGFGIDSYYGWRVMPVYGTLSWDAIKIRKGSAIFFQLNYGRGLFQAYDFADQYGFKDMEAGRMVFPQLGFRTTYHDLRLSLLVGYKNQNVITYFEYPSWYRDWTGSMIAGSPSHSTVTQQIERLAITVGLGWR